MFSSDRRQKTTATETHITQKDIDQVRQHQRIVLMAPTEHDVVQIESPNKNMSDQWQHFQKTNDQHGSNDKNFLPTEEIEKGNNLHIFFIKKPEKDLTLFFDI